MIGLIPRPTNTRASALDVRSAKAPIFMNKPYSSFRFLLKSSVLAAAAFAGFLFILAAPAQAATYYWGTTTANNIGDSFWTTDSTGSGALTALSSTNDVLYFNGSDLTGTNTGFILSGGTSVGGLVFNNSALTSGSNSSGSTLALTIGSGGITINPGSSISIGSSAAAAAQISMKLGAAQTWTNNGSAWNLLNRNPINLNGFNLTIDGASNITQAPSSSNVGAITGAGGLTKNGANTLTLQQVNDYTGITVVNSGTLVLSNTAALQGSILDTTGTGTIVLGVTGTMNFGGLTGSGSLNATSISGYGSVTGLTLKVAGGSTGTFTGDIAEGTAGMGLVKLGVGTQIFSGSNGYTGATIISAGTLQLGSGGTTGALNPASSITNNGSLVFNRSNTVTQGNDFAGTIVGTGSVAQIGIGTLILNGSNSYTGATTLNSGTLQLGNANAVASSALTSSTTGALTFSSGIGAFNIGSLIGSGSLSLTDPASAAVTLNVGSTGVSGTYNGVVTGAGGIVKSGTGTMWLGNAANSFGGGVTVLSGVLNGQGNFGTIYGTGTLALGDTSGTANATMMTTQATWSNAIWSRAGSSGTNTMILNGAAAVVHNGTVLLDKTLVLNTNAGTFTFNNTISGAGGLTKGTGTNVTTLTGTNTYTGPTTILQGILTIGGAGYLGSTGTYAGAIANSGSFVYGSSAAQNFSGTLSGTGVFIKSGAGALTLSGSNAYSGPTSVTAGNLQFANANALYGGTTANWTGTNIKVSSGGTVGFYLGGPGEFAAGDITSLLTTLSGTTGAGLLSGAAIGFNTTNSPGNSFTVADVINNSVNGSLGVAKFGANTLVLSASNSFTGNVTLNQGTLNYTDLRATGTGNNIVFTGNSMLKPGVSGTIFSGFTINTGVTATVDTGALTINLLKGISASAGTLVKIGSGTLNLATASATYTGAIFIKEGTLLTNNNNGAAGTGVITIGDSVLGADAALSINSQTVPLFNSAIVLASGSGTRTIQENNAQNATTFLTPSVSGTHDLIVQAIAGAKLNMTGTINNIGAISTGTTASNATLNLIGQIGSNVTALNHTGAGLLALFGTNTFAGPTTVTSGTLSLSNNLALQNSALDTTGMGGAGVAVLGSGVTTPILGGLNGGVDLSTAITTNYSAMTALTLNPISGTSSYSGAIADGFAGMSLAKTGSGTQVLSGASTYTGATSITGGKLVVSGSLMGTSGVTMSGAAAELNVNGFINAPVAVNSGTLTGSGSVGAVTVLSGATVSPGNSPGTLSVASFSGTSGATLSIQLGKTTAGAPPVAGSDYDQVNSAGAVALNDMTLSLSAYGVHNVEANDLFFIILNGGGSAGTFSGVAEGSLVSDGSNLYYVTYLANRNTTTVANFGSAMGNDVALMAVPEPSTWAMLVSGMGMLVFAQRRRR